MFENIDIKKKDSWENALIKEAKEQQKILRAAWRPRNGDGDSENTMG